MTTNILKAIENMSTEEIANYFKKNNLDINMKTSMRLRSLVKVALSQKKEKEAMRIFNVDFYDKNNVDYKKRTDAHYAIKCNLPNSAVGIMEHEDFDVSKPDELGNLPIMYAASMLNSRFSYYAFEEMLNSPKSTEQVLNHRNNKRDDLASVIISSGSRKFFEDLIKSKKYSFTEKDGSIKIYSDKNTLAHLEATKANTKGNIEYANYILQESKMDINTVNMYGETVLDTMIEHRRNELDVEEIAIIKNIYKNANYNVNNRHHWRYGNFSEGVNIVMTLLFYGKIEIALEFLEDERFTDVNNDLIICIEDVLCNKSSECLIRFLDICKNKTKKKQR